MTNSAFTANAVTEAQAIEAHRLNIVGASLEAMAQAIGGSLTPASYKLAHIASLVGRKMARGLSFDLAKAAIIRAAKAAQ